MIRVIRGSVFLVPHARIAGHGMTRLVRVRNQLLVNRLRNWRAPITSSLRESDNPKKQDSDSGGKRPRGQWGRVWEPSRRLSRTGGDVCSYVLRGPDR